MAWRLLNSVRSFKGVACERCRRQKSGQAADEAETAADRGTDFPWSCRVMGYLTTHVLDLVSGQPAVGMALTVSMMIDGQMRVVAEAVTNHDGRVDKPLLEGAAFDAGVYQIEFHVGAYFKTVAGGDAVPFLDVVPLRFGVGDAASHYHVPLLVTPWSYSTYRGS